MRRAIRSIAFDDGLLLVADEDRLFLLDDVAARIWRAIESGLSRSEIVDVLTKANPAQASRIRQDVADLLARWSEEGLVDSVLEPRGSTVWAGKWRCRFGNRVVDVAIENPREARVLGRLFEHFQADGPAADDSIEVRSNRSGESVAFVNGREYARNCATRNVQRALIELVWPSYRLCALVHAGAVAHGDKAACIAGLSGSGKTTLVARLVSRGLTYLADDVTPISTCGRVLPWPLPMSVKLDSWDVLSESYPALETASVFDVKGTQARLLKPANDVWSVEPRQLHVLIFPEFVRGAPTRLARLTQFDALRRLIEAGFLIESPITDQRIDAVLGWLNASPAYSLGYGDVDDAASHALRLMSAA